MIVVSKQFYQSWFLGLLQLNRFQKQLRLSYFTKRATEQRKRRGCDFPHANKQTCLNIYLKITSQGGKRMSSSLSLDFHSYSYWKANAYIHRKIQIKTTNSIAYYTGSSYKLMRLNCVSLYVYIFVYLQKIFIEDTPGGMIWADTPELSKAQVKGVCIFPCSNLVKLICL